MLAVHTIWMRKYSNASAFAWVLRYWFADLLARSSADGIRSNYYFQIKRNDKLTTKLCQMCFVKINEIAQFRDVCAATDIELRILLELSNENDGRRAIVGPDIEPRATNEIQDISSDNLLIFRAPNGGNADYISSDTEMQVFLTSNTIRWDKFHFHFHFTLYSFCRDRSTSIGSVQTRPIPNADSGCSVWEASAVQSKLLCESSVEDSIIAVTTSAKTTETNCARDSQRSKMLEEPSLRENGTDSQVASVESLDAKKGESKCAAKTKKRVKRNAANIVEQSVFVCQFRAKCRESFKLRSALEHHMSTYHAKGVEKSYCCHLCQRSFRSKPTLQRHISAKHIGVKSFQCPFPMCPMAFERNYNLNKHVNVIHGKDSSPFKCTKCPTIFYRSFHLKYHLENEHGQGSLYRCHLCGTTLASKHSLEIHMISKHNGVKPFTCPFATCSKAFAQKFDLIRHVDIHHKQEIAFHCPNCSYKTHYKQCLTRHVANSHGKAANVPTSAANAST